MGHHNQYWLEEICSQDPDTAKSQICILSESEYLFPIYHGSEKPRAKITSGVNSKRCLHTKRYADAQKDDEEDQGYKPSWWRPIPLVGSSHNNHEENRGGGKLREKARHRCHVRQLNTHQYIILR